MSRSDTTAVRDYLLALQGGIVAAFEDEEGLPFRRDSWQRPAGGMLEGEGLSQLIEEGHVLERGGCNFSHVKGASLPPSATQHRGELAGAPFEALGVSLVMHPRNPLCAHGAHERAAAGGIPTRPGPGGVVRRRHGPHAVLRF